MFRAVEGDMDMARMSRIVTMLIASAFFLIIAVTLVSCVQSGRRGSEMDDQAVIDEIVSNFEKLAAIPRKSGHEQAVSRTVKT